MYRGAEWDNFPFKYISVLIVPTDYCNMDCVYCFNSRKTSAEKKVMSEGILRKIFETTIPYYKEVNFIWHGGEPLSAGKEFYKTAIDMQKEINAYGTEVKNSVQSNLTLIDEDWAEFLVQNDVNVGGSYDGTQNELTRHNSARILEGYEQFKKCGGRNGFICVVQRKNIDHLIEDYKWFKSRGMNYTLNPYIAQYPPADDAYFVPAEYYVKKMCELFDYWMYDHECNIRIAYFAYFINFILFKKKRLCCYNLCLGKHVGIHYNGDIYCCNRDFGEEYCFGNINDYTDIRQCFVSQGFENILSAAIIRRNRCKEKCDIYDFCAGGCNSDAVVGGDISKNNDYLCQILIAVYDHIKDAIISWSSKSPNEVNASLNPSVAKKILVYQQHI